MFRSRTGGFTLVEILIASALALVVFGALLSVFLNSRKIGRTARESFYLSEDMSIALRTLTTDLKSTSLSSIKVESDGFSLASPHTPGREDGFEVTPYGGVKWKKWVHYRLEPGDDVRERLVRSESDIGEDLYPLAPPTPPAASGKVLLNNILRRDKAVEKSSDGRYRVIDKAGTPPGFPLRFVGRDGTRLEENPAEHSDEDRPGWTQNTTPLVELCLQIVDTPSDSKVATLQIYRQLTPRN